MILTAKGKASAFYDCGSLVSVAVLMADAVEQHKHSVLSLSSISSLPCPHLCIAMQDQQLCDSWYCSCISVFRKNKTIKEANVTD